MEKREVTIPQPVLFVLWQLKEAGYEGYVVGGAVRDMLMGKETSDWDFTTNATPEQIGQVFQGTFYNNMYGMVGLPYEPLIKQMTAEGWQAKKTPVNNPGLQHVFEITTYRTEQGYTDRRRPDKVMWGKSILEDLSRRDFTLNAMAVTVDRDIMAGLAAFTRKEAETTLEVTIIDPYNGQRDIREGLIRAVRDPNERFCEDALRMMRAIRIGAQLGFGIETHTLKAITVHAELIDKIAWERIRDELLKILASDFPADGITLLYNAGLLAQIMPELLAMRGVRQAGHHRHDVWTHSLESLRNCPSSDPIVRLATLLHDVGKPKTYQEQGPRGVTFYGHEVVGARMAKEIGRRIRLPRENIDRLYILVRWHMFTYQPEMTDAAIRRFIKRVGLNNINEMMLLRVGDRKGGGSEATSWRLRELQERIGQQLYEPLSLKDLKINGTDLIENLHLRPGPKIGFILNQLFEEVMEDSSKNKREWLLERAAEINAE